jgi:endonuclease-8
VPEGDTIHRVADRLRDAIAGHEVTRVELRRDPRGLRPPEPGTVVTDVEARGKHLLVCFADGATLHTHMQLHGAWHVYQPGERWRRAGHRARVIVEVDDGTTAVCFDAPVVELRREGRAHAPSRALEMLDRLGPDLATSSVDLDAVLARLATLAPETTIGDALLDQRVAAGLGNVYRSEVCWARRVHPATPLAALDDAQRRAIYTTAHEQLLANTQTTRRVTYEGGLAVYGKHRRPCPRCGTPIRREWKETQAKATQEPQPKSTSRSGTNDRVTYWCPRCQPARD